MKNFFGTAVFMMFNGCLIHHIWCAVVLVTALAAPVIYRRRYEGTKGYGRLIFLLPLLMTTVHYFIFAAGSPDLYTRMYLIAIIEFVPMLCAEADRGREFFTGLTAVLSVMFGILFNQTSMNFHNYTRRSYTKSFHSMVKQLDSRYVLKEWKEIDFSALEEKYMPMVRQAESESDPAMFYDAVYKFCNELHDDHVRVYYDFDTEKYPLKSELHDYGLCMVQLDSGDVIAICTKPSANSKGINDGTVITKWDGRPVLQAAEDVPDEGVPVKTNADRLALAELSATGGDTVEVTYIDNSGKEQTAVLSALEQESTLEEASDAFLQSSGGMRDIAGKNGETRMLTDKCGYLALTVETTGSNMYDNLSFYGSGNKRAKETFRRKLTSLKEQGMEYLVIDLRNNMGGTGEIGYALCELLTNEDIYASGIGYRSKGEYHRLRSIMIHGSGEFADLKVVALTNMNCLSAGDSTAQCLAKLQNVTLAGITDPSGSGQMTGGCCALTNGEVTVQFPIGLNLDENGDIDIDPRADRVSRDPVEVRIPLDYDAAMRIFRDKYDYELEWAMNYLEGDV